MIGKIGTNIGKYFSNCGYIQEEDIDAVRYYIEVWFNEYFQIMINILIGLWINQLDKTIIFLLIFMVLRKYYEGYHAKTIVLCNFIAYSLYFIAIYLTNIICNDALELLLILLFILCMCVDVIKHNKNYLMNITMIVTCIFLFEIFAYFSVKEYCILIIITVIEVIILRLIKKRDKINESD